VGVRVGAGGESLVIADRPDDPRLAELPGVPLIAQPLVTSIRTEGEISVFVLGGRPVSQVRKVPATGEIRAHDYRGAVYLAESLGDEQATLSLAAVEAAARLAGRPLDYARVDMLLYDGRWCVGEIEAVEPGLYLDLLPANAEPFADVVLTALSGSVPDVWPPLHEPKG
jgi:glutathione synthase/RimK-type ligase-like ATP-grasp enzyme